MKTSAIETASKATTTTEEYDYDPYYFPDYDGKRITKIFLVEITYKLLNGN